MFIEEIYLVNFNRFNTSEIKTFHWTPKSNISLILATNGAGKSSLLNELNPMPADKNDYDVGGMKRFVATLDDVRYELTSDFTSGQKHSFKRIIDGVEEELNQSATVTVQKELVETYFRYTNKIHQLLTGKLKFTKLSPTSRKELLMDISPLQLDYANNLFDQVKTLIRDNQGALKHQLNKCSEIETRLASIEINEDESTINYLEDMVAKLLPFKGTKNVDLETLWSTISNILTTLESNVNKFNKWRDDIKLPSPIKDINSLNNLIGVKEGLLQSSINQVAVMTKKSFELNKVIEQLDSKHMSRDEIVERVGLIERELSSFKESYFISGNWDNLINEFNNFSMDIENVFPAQKVSLFSKEEIQESKDAVEYLSLQLSRIKSIHFNLSERLNHLLNDEKTVVCPKCATSLSVSGIDIETEINNTKEKKVNAENHILEIENNLNALKPKDGDIDLYTNLKDRITNVIRRYGHLIGLLDSYDINKEVDNIISNVSNFTNSIQNLNRHIRQCEKFHGLIKELNTYKTSLEQYDILGGDVGTVYQKLENDISIAVTEQRDLEKDLKYLKNAAAMFNHFLLITEQAEVLLNKLFETFKEWVDVSIQNDARQRLEENYSRLGAIKHLVNLKAQLIKSKEETFNDIEQLKMTQQDFEVLSQILSPSKGIIADQMTAFLNSYIDQINSVIEQIWEHQLEILHVSMDSGVLDYKFRAEKEGQKIPDIVECSTGQEDVINLGFVLVMRQYLNLINYPLYLDETGATFDPLHRTSLMRFIKLLLDTEQCQQIFMINHYADWHGSLSNHETVVLDSRNLVVPNVYNQNVIINGEAR